MRGRPRVACVAPERVRGLEGGKRPRYIQLLDDDGVRWAQRRDDLLIGDVGGKRPTEMVGLGGVERGKERTDVRWRRARLER